MKARFQKLRQKKGKNFDPLVHEDFNWDNEWADSLHVVPEGGRGCDLTWDLVDNAIGASKHFVAETYREEPIMCIQEEILLLPKICQRLKRKMKMKKMFHMMMQKSQIVKMNLMVAMMVKKGRHPISQESLMMIFERRETGRVAIARLH